MAKVKPLRLRMKLSNNLLIRLREELGMSAREAANAIGLSYGIYVQIENLRRKPYGRKPGFGPPVYGWRDSAQKIADYYRVPPESLFPGDVIAVEKTTTQIEVTAEELGSLALGSGGMNPEQELETKELVELCERRLPRKMLQALGSVAEGASYKEAGDDLGVSRERARQIVHGARRRIQDVLEREGRR